MGLIKAAINSVSGNLADQWLEVLEPDNMSKDTVVTRGVLVNRKKSVNTKGSTNIVSNGSVVHVYPNQMMLLVDGGRIIDYCGEEGYYTVNTSTSPSLFNGEFKESLKETFNRFRFGGISPQTQQVYYVNLQEITDIKFGTKTPIQYFDEFYGAELSLRCHGSYSIKITDPLKFFAEAVPRNASRIDIAAINGQYLDEFLNALQSAICQLSLEGEKVIGLIAKSMKLAKYLADCLDEDWNNMRGFEISKVAIASISYNENSQKIIDMVSQNAAMSKPHLRETYVQTAVADGLKAAGSNSGGSSQAFMGMGMGMNVAGGFMNTVSQTNNMQMQQEAQRQAQQQAAAQQQQAAAQSQQTSGGWKCSCGKVNTGKFCSECGSKQPEETSWKCSCGKVNTGKFCSECGSKKPEDRSWQCSCGQINEGKFCSGCGAARP